MEGARATKLTMASKAVLLTNIISPYRIPLFNCIENKGEFEFRVIALSETEVNREWEIIKDSICFKYEILPGWHNMIQRRDLPVHLNRGVFRALHNYAPDVIIATGYDCPAYWQALLYAKLFHKAFILCNESTLLSTIYRGGVMGKVKQYIVGRADACIAYGIKSTEYLKAFGANPYKIYTGIDTVDMEYFQREVVNCRNIPDFHTRRKHFPEVLLLFVGQLIPRKGLMNLLKALCQVHDPDIGLLIVGSGPQEKQLKQFCIDHKLQNVYFEGFQQQAMLPMYYALADVMLVPSIQEVWGLVVNEALASGLYVLCSKYAGAAYDLIDESWNGRLFDPDDIEELSGVITETMRQIKEIRDRRTSISEHACKEFSIERSAQPFIAAIEAVQNQSNA